MWILYSGQIGIWTCWFLWREENRTTWRKTCRANSTHIWHWAGIKPRPRWWEERTVTTASSMLDVLNFECDVPSNFHNPSTETHLAALGTAGIAQYQNK